MSGGTGWIWTFTYTFFRTFFLFWISPYSLFTVRNSGWLTRGKAEEEAQKTEPDPIGPLPHSGTVFAGEATGGTAPARFQFR